MTALGRCNSVESLRRQETMLPNKKMDSFRDDNQGVPTPSSEPHVVVTCPTCRTKFAVEGSLVASFEAPRFHCSRCDAVFELGAQAQQSKTSARQTKDRRWVLAGEPAGAPYQHNDNHSTPSVQPMLKPTDFSLGNASPAELAPQQPFAIFPTSNERPGLSLLGLNTPPEHTHSRAESEGLDAPALTRRTPPVSVKQISPSIASDPFSLFDDPTIPTNKQTTSTSATPSTQWTVGDQPPTKVETPNKPPIAGSPSAALAQNADIAPTEKPKAWADPSTRGRLLATTVARLSIRTRSLAYLSAPLLAVMGLLLTTGYSSYLAPQTLDAGLQAVVPSIITGSTAQLPPSDLSVQDISLEFVKTQSREEIGIVRGIVHNNSAATLNDVRLEALGFDDRGQIVVRAQAPLRSALAREQVSDLSLATVRKFQESLSASSSKIAAGERVAFTVALLDSSSGEGMPVDLSQVRYFSARVFSVAR